MIGITAYSGQICAAGSRLYVQAGIYDNFVAAFKDMYIRTVFGDPLLPESTKGLVISQIQQSKIMGHIQKGVDQGARLLHGEKEIPGKGNFVENTAFVDVGDDMSSMQE